MDLGSIHISSGSGGWADYPAGATFGPRTLRDYEWVWIVEGAVIWELEGAEHPMPAGSVLLARPGMRDAFRWDPERRTRHGFIHCRIDDPEGVLPPPDQWPLIVRPGGENVLLPLLRHAQAIDASDPLGAHVVEHSLRLALVAFVHGGAALPGQLRGVDEHPVLARAMAALRARWARGRMEPLTLGELAAAAEVSPGHLIRVFQAELGTSPQEAQRVMRLDRAATLLTRSNLKIQDIAEQCGFACPFHFSRLFKRSYGASPRALRQRLRAGGSPPTTSLMRRLGAAL